MVAKPFELSTELMPLNSRERDTSASGLPSYLLDYRAEEVIRLLAANNIDPHTAYFRGRPGESKNPAVAEGVERPTLTPLTPYTPGSFTDALDVYDGIYDEEAAKKIAREGPRRQTDGPPPVEYTFSKLATLFIDDTILNPIHAAGVTSGSFLDVYDKNVVDSLDSSGEGSLMKIAAIPDEQLALAAVAHIKLMYESVS